MIPEPKRCWIPAKAYRKGRTRDIASIMLHSTDGRQDSDIAELTTKRDKSIHYYVTRSGHIYQFVQESDTAFHAGRVSKSFYSNAATIGIEMEHFDGREDWPAQQVNAVAHLVAWIRERRGDLPVVSHAAAAAPPGRKQDPLSFRWGLLSHYVQEWEKC